MLQHGEVMVLFMSTANPPTEAGRSTLDKNKTGGQKEKGRMAAGSQNGLVFHYVHVKLNVKVRSMSISVQFFGSWAELSQPTSATEAML